MSLYETVLKLFPKLDSCIIWCYFLSSRYLEACRSLFSLLTTVFGDFEDLKPDPIDPLPRFTRWNFSVNRILSYRFLLILPSSVLNNVPDGLFLFIPRVVLVCGSFAVTYS